MIQPRLLRTIDRLLPGIEAIAPERVEKLFLLTTYIESKRAQNQPIRLVFLSTDNARRSLLAQAWAHVAAQFQGVPQVECFSGAMSPTAFSSPSAFSAPAAALERAGFLLKNLGGERPHYEVAALLESEPLLCFSKAFDHEQNPKSGFAAVMTCKDADATYPVSEDSERFSLPYPDLKVSDGTGQETLAYDALSDQIGTEMLAVFGSVDLGV